MTLARVVGVAAKDYKNLSFCENRKPREKFNQSQTSIARQCACDHDSANFQKQKLYNHGLLMALKTAPRLEESISCSRQVCKALQCSE